MNYPMTERYEDAHKHVERAAGLLPDWRRWSHSPRPSRAIAAARKALAHPGPEGAELRKAARVAAYGAFRAAESADNAAYMSYGEEKAIAGAAADAAFTAGCAAEEAGRIEDPDTDD